MAKDYTGQATAMCFVDRAPMQDIGDVEKMLRGALKPSRQAMRGVEPLAGEVNGVRRFEHELWPTERRVPAMPVIYQVPRRADLQDNFFLGLDSQQSGEPCWRRIMVADDPIHVYPLGKLPQRFDDLHIALLQASQARIIEQVARQNQSLAANRVQKAEEVIPSAVSRTQVQIANDDRVEVHHVTRFLEWGI